MPLILNSCSLSEFLMALRIYVRYQFTLHRNLKTWRASLSMQQWHSHTRIHTYTPVFTWCYLFRINSGHASHYNHAMNFIVKVKTTLLLFSEFLKVEFRAVKQQFLLLGHSWISWSVEQLKHACPYCHGNPHYDALTHSCVCLSVCVGEDWEIDKPVMIMVRLTGVPSEYCSPLMASLWPW